MVRKPPHEPEENQAEFGENFPKAQSGDTLEGPAGFCAGTFSKGTPEDDLSPDPEHSHYIGKETNRRNPGGLLKKATGIA